MKNLRTEVVAMIQHLISDRPGPWRVSILGSQETDQWEMKITGPNGFERSYTLEASAGEHRAEVIRVILGKMLPAKNSEIRCWQVPRSGGASRVLYDFGALFPYEEISASPQFSRDKVEFAHLCL